MHIFQSCFGSSFLIHNVRHDQDDRAQNQPGEVQNQRLLDHQADGAGQKDAALRQLQVAPAPAEQGQRHIGAADHGCNNREDHWNCDAEGPASRVKAEQFCVVQENKGDDKPGSRHFDGLKAGLPHISARNTDGGEDRQGNRRRDGGDNAIVEDEHMGADGGDAQVDHGRSHQNAEDDVTGRGGQAHAQHDADHGGQDAHNEDDAAGEHGDEAADPQAQAGDVDGRDDNAGNHAGDGHGHDGICAVLAELEQIFDRELLPVGNQADDQAEQDRDQRAALGAQADDQHHNQGDDGQEVKPAALEDLAHGFRVGIGGLDRDVMLMGIGVDRHGEGQVVQHRREQSRQANRRIGQPCGIGHQECHRAHDRRHDLSAIGSAGLHRAGGVLVKPGFLHQRNGEGAGGHDIGRAGTVDHAHEHTGVDRRLGRAAAEFAERREGNVHKELARANKHQHRAEDDEQEDEVCGGGQGAAEQALIAHQKVRAHPQDGDAGGGQGPRQIAPDQGVDQEYQRQRGEHLAQGAVGDEQGHHHEDDGDDSLVGAVKHTGGGVGVAHHHHLPGGQRGDDDQQEVNGAGNGPVLHGLDQQEKRNHQRAVNHSLGRVVQRQERRSRQKVEQGQDDRDNQSNHIKNGSFFLRRGQDFGFFFAHFASSSHCSRPASR